MNRVLFAALVTALAISAAGCIYLVRSVEVRPVAQEEELGHVVAPIRVHLRDGHIAHFRDGAQIGGGYIRGQGTLYDLRLVSLGPITEVAFTDVIGVEAARQNIDVPLSVGVSLLSTVATPFLLVAIFGSCPTVYSSPMGAFDDEAFVVLEAETFSHSIAPLLEARTVHRLQARPVADEGLRLEVRNEALETHRINHIELIEVSHAAGLTAYPTPRGSAVALGRLHPPKLVVDRTGRDVTALLATADGAAYATDNALLAQATPDELIDWIDLEFDRPNGDEAHLLLNYRDSLLGTILFYEKLLAGQGPAALDWLHGDLQTVSRLLALGNFYIEHMGLRIYGWSEGGYRLVQWLPHVGPIAWHQTAVPIPLPVTSGPVRLRLEFPMDAWRIDRVALAEAAGPVREVPLSAAALLDADGRPLIEALELVSRADGSYLTTMPGSRFTLVFEPQSPAPDTAVTYFLAMQGYYTEWMRPDWLQRAPRRLNVSATTLHDAIHSWRSQREAFEHQFFKTKIPVR